MAGDDFVIPGTGEYKISAVYAPGETLSGLEPSHILITFHDVFRYSEKCALPKMPVFYGRRRESRFRGRGKTLRSTEVDCPCAARRGTLAAQAGRCA
jgi:hypothetical protein